MKSSLPKHDKKEKLICEGKICPYCSSKTVYVDSLEVYDRSYGMIYLCRPCKAWVGVHTGTKKALGRIADLELRQAKKETHFYFDKLWAEKMKSGFTKNAARGKAYKWLAFNLGIPAEEAHVGWFDLKMCRKAIEICKPLVEKMNL